MPEVTRLEFAPILRAFDGSGQLQCSHKSCVSRQVSITGSSSAYDANNNRSSSLEYVCGSGHRSAVWFRQAGNSVFAEVELCGT